MGKVYRALDTRLDRAVALKFLNSVFFADGSERLVREARAAASLDHPNICSIYEVVEDESRCFIVMQYVEGETLANRLARKPVDVSEALEITGQIADALGEAHARGIVHRDVKPQNIMLTPRGQAKVLDFGLATSVTPIDASKSEAETPKHVTEIGPVAGTVGYMSPEQARGQELDARTDLFSLSVVLFEMGAGISPFRRTTVQLTFDAILNHLPAAPRQINPTLPAELERIILKGLEKDRDLRYQSAPELLADLKRLQRDLQVAHSTEGAPPARRTWRHLGYSLAGLVIAAVVATFVLSRPESLPSATERPYVQLTNFTDSATNPAVSPDGRMVAFIRGSSTFLDQGQVYVKHLPDGEPVPLTRDDRPKMAPVFSPDGSRIAYTVSVSGWETWMVPVSGGETRPMLANAAALTWFGDRRILFSEIKRGLQMAIVTGTESRSEVRDVYVPSGMAHRSYVSPDHKWVLVASEMNASGWLPCRKNRWPASRKMYVRGVVAGRAVDVLFRGVG
jgi:serine/threonine protein kinase